MSHSFFSPWLGQKHRNVPKGWMWGGVRPGGCTSSGFKRYERQTCDLSVLSSSGTVWNRSTPRERRDSGLFRSEAALWLAAGGDVIYRYLHTNMYTLWIRRERALPCKKRDLWSAKTPEMTIIRPFCEWINPAEQVFWFLRGDTAEKRFQALI